MINFRLS